MPKRPPYLPLMRDLAAFALVVCTALPGFSPPAAYAQALELPLPSMPARVVQRVGISTLSVDYSSPAVRGRTIWGDVVPFDRPWRSGANKVTKLTVSHDFSFGGQAVKAGSYALYTIPAKAAWTIVLSSDADAWGMPPLDPAKDVVRVTAKSETIGFRERLAYVFSDATQDSVRLDLEWEKLRISVPIKLDTSANIAAAMTKLRDDAWELHLSSARYLLENGGDLKDALSYIDTSIAIEPSWSNTWMRAQILAQQGKTAEAVEAAQKARKLGAGSRQFEAYYKADIDKALAEWKKKKR